MPDFPAIPISLLTALLTPSVTTLKFDLHDKSDIQEVDVLQDKFDLLVSQGPFLGAFILMRFGSRGLPSPAILSSLLKAAKKLRMLECKICDLGLLQDLSSQIGTLIIRAVVYNEEHLRESLKMLAGSIRAGDKGPYQLRGLHRLKVKIWETKTIEVNVEAEKNELREACEGRQIQLKYSRLN